MQTLRKLLEMIRFSHTVFALPFAFLSAILAWNIEPRPRTDLSTLLLQGLGILLCMVTARSFAMAFNRLVDRHIDARNPRTAVRHLPAGTLSLGMVRLFCALSALGFVAATGLFALQDPPNPWPPIFSLPVLLFLAGYSYTKRFTSLAHYWLGAALMLAPVCAWIAIRGLEGLLLPGMLGLAVLFWVAGFDILYACQDADFDAKEGLKSIPARFGIRRSLRLAAASHAVMFGFLACLPLVAPPLGLIYGVGLVAIGILLIYQHAIVRPDDLTRVNQAFFHVNGIISMGLLLLVIVQLTVR